MCVPQQPFTCSKHSLPTRAMSSFSRSFCAGVSSLLDGVMARCFEDGRSKTRERGRAMAMVVCGWLSLSGQPFTRRGRRIPGRRLSASFRGSLTLTLSVFRGRQRRARPSASHQKVGQLSAPRTTRRDPETRPAASGDVCYHDRTDKSAILGRARKCFEVSEAHRCADIRLPRSLYRPPPAETAVPKHHGRV